MYAFLYGTFSNDSKAEAVSLFSCQGFQKKMHSVKLQQGLHNRHRYRHTRTHITHLSASDHSIASGSPRICMEHASPGHSSSGSPAGCAAFFNFQFGRVKTETLQECITKQSHGMSTSYSHGLAYCDNVGSVSELIFDSLPPRGSLGECCRGPC